MMSPDDRVLEDLLYGSDLGDKPEELELGGVPAEVEAEASAAENVNIKGFPIAFYLIVMKQALNLQRNQD